MGEEGGSEKPKATFDPQSKAAPPAARNLVYSYADCLIDVAGVIFPHGKTQPRRLEVRFA